MMQWMWSDAAALSNDLHPPPGFNIAVRSIAQARVIWRANACYVTEYTVCSGLFKSLDPVTLYSLPPLRRRDAVGSKQRSEEHTSDTPVTNAHLVCRLQLAKKNGQEHIILSADKPHA